MFCRICQASNIKYIVSITNLSAIKILSICVYCEKMRSKNKILWNNSSLNSWYIWQKHTWQTQSICITFIQRRPNVEGVGPILHKYYTNVLCLLRRKWISSSTIFKLHIFTSCEYVYILSPGNVRGWIPYRKYTEKHIDLNNVGNITYSWYHWSRLSFLKFRLFTSVVSINVFLM